MAETSIRYLNQVLSVVSQFKITEQACLESVGLKNVPNSNRVDASIVANIFRFASENLNDPLIGIRCGVKYPILQYTRPAEFLKLCENIAQAAELYHSYCPLFHTVGRPSPIISDNGMDRMVWTPEFEPEEAETYRQLVEFIMVNLVTSINWLAWKTQDAVQQINIAHEPLAPFGQYQDLFECEVKFGQDEYSVVLKAGVKEDPFSTADKGELAKIKVRLDLALNELLENESFIDRVELHIRRAIETDSPSKANVAKALGVSERSLGRLLAEKGTAFKDVKTRVIKDLAVAKINQNLPLAEIAHSLGYNDQSAFTRAFKNWFGYPPGKSKTSKPK